MKYITEILFFAFIIKGYEALKQHFKVIAPSLFALLEKQKQVVKYIIAGSTATGVDLLLLFVLTDIFKIYYLLSAALAFIAAFFVSFFLQKFWTFRETSRDRMRRQMIMYFTVGVMNLVINSLGMYFLVDYLRIMYLLAQTMMAAIIPVISFLIYKFIIFKKPLYGSG